MNQRTRAALWCALLACCLFAPVAAQQVELIRTIGMPGTGDGQFDFPHNMALDSNGNIYVPDFFNQRVQKLDANGDFVRSWGSQGDGPGEFDGPVGIAVDGQDNVYVVEFNNHRVQKFDSAGNFITQWGVRGAGSGNFNSPSGIAVDAGGDVLVADRSNHRIQKFTGNGVFVAAFGSRGSADGRFELPTGIGLDGDGNILVADQGNHRIQKFGPDFAFIDQFGQNGSALGQFINPADVAVAEDGRIFVVDKDNHRIQVFGANLTALGEFGSRGRGLDQFDFPRGIIVDDERIFVADRNNDRLLEFADLSGAGFLVDATISGSWFDPSHDGEGWKVEVLPGGQQAVIYWFTFPPPGQPGTQAWIGGVGRIQGDQIIVNQEDSFITAGGVFADPNRNVEVSSWGSFTFTFTGPNAGTMDYSGPSEWGAGSLNLQRLTSVIGNPVSAEANVGAGISGSWISPDFASEGWLIEVIGEKQALVYWFTYDDQGRQAWNLGIGAMTANSILVFGPVQGVGTNFGPTFNPSDVVREAWGAYIFTFDDCNNGAITYFGQKGQGSSQYSLSRLTNLEGADCEDFNRTKGAEAPSFGAVCTNPDDPTLLISFRDDGHNGLFFGAKTPSGLAQSLDKVLIKPVAGVEGEADSVIDVMEGGMQTRGSDVASGNTVSVNMAPDSDEILIRGVTKGGALQSIIRSAFSQLTGAGGGKKADLSHQVVQGGRVRSGSTTAWSSPIPAKRPATRYTKATDAVSVTVDRCGIPVPEAAVSTTITSPDSESLKILLAGREMADGLYDIPVPTQAASGGELTPGDDQCTGFTDQASSSCALFDRLEDRNFPALCATAASAMIELDDPESEQALATKFFASCSSTLASGKLVCDSAGSEQATGAMTRENFVCTGAPQVDRALDAMVEKVKFSTVVSFPGSNTADIVRTDSREYPSEGPFPEYSFILEGAPAGEGFDTDPPVPDPRVGYTATATLVCLPANTVVNIDVQGSDGFTSSGSCTITGNGQCNLQIPGGGQGTRDTLTVSLPSGETRRVKIVF